MTFEELRTKNLERCEEVFHPLKSWNEMEWGACVAEECGEMLNFMKKRKRQNFDNN